LPRDRINKGGTPLLICKNNALDFDKVLQNPGPVVTSILTIWYKSHLAEGGQPDVLMEALKSGR